MARFLTRSTLLQTLCALFYTRRLPAMRFYIEGQELSSRNGIDNEMVCTVSTQAICLSMVAYNCIKTRVPVFQNRSPLSRSVFNRLAIFPLGRLPHEVRAIFMCRLVSPYSKTNPFTM
ncbi:hypothetical protein EDD21DRAFT_110360 [Dissophora ornata]|nr:hypothetical protein EDD21DRAFT_110360 [Dissophora ornata]